VPAVLKPVTALERTRFRGGLVFKAHGLLYHSTLGFRVMKKKNSAHIRQSGPDSRPGVQVKVLKSFYAVPSLAADGEGVQVGV